MKLVKAAYIVAFLAAALLVVSAITDEIVLLPAAVIPLMAGIGIVRRRVWSAYGYALFQCVGFFAMPFLVSAGIKHPQYCRFPPSGLETTWARTR